MQATVYIETPEEMDVSKTVWCYTQSPYEYVPEEFSGYPLRVIRRWDYPKQFEEYCVPTTNNQCP